MAYMAATKPTYCDKGLQPCHTSADGNCLFNALSIAVCGDERYSTEFRVRTCVEMAINETYYASQPFGDDFQYVAPDYQDASVETAKNGQHANAWTIQAACNVLGRTITALYPTENGVNDPVAAMLTRQHIPRAPVTTEAPVNIMWTRTTQRYDLTKTWLPNHFVPVIAMYTDDSSSETFSSRSSTPVKNDGGVATMELDESNIQLATGVKGVDLSEFQYDALRQADASMVAASGDDISASCIDVQDDECHATPIAVSCVSGDLVEYAPMETDSKSNTDESVVGENCSVLSVQDEPQAEGVHPLTCGEMLAPWDVLTIANSDKPALACVPRGKKENVYVVIDNSENVMQVKQKNKAQFWDDCGAWNHAKGRSVKTKYWLKQESEHGHRLLTIIMRDGIAYTETRESGRRALKALNPQPDEEEIVIVHRYYTSLKRDPKYKKRVTWLEGVPEHMRGDRHVAVVEYTGVFTENETPHGNSKVNDQPYERTDPKVAKKIEDLAEVHKPAEIYTKMTTDEANTSNDYPRDLKQCQNYRSKTKAKTGYTSNNVADEILHVANMLSNKHPFVAEMVHSRDTTLPIIICYTEEQMVDFTSFMASNAGVVGVDRTFSLGKCFVTTTVYKSHKVIRKSTGEPPILLGPMMLHWDGKQQNYFKFFSHLRCHLGTEINTIDMLLGTDDERAMTNAIDMAMPGCTRKLCTRHIKDNITRHLTDKCPKSVRERQEIQCMIFGEDGVANADDSADFDQRQVELKETLEKRHPDFIPYYEKNVAPKLAEHVVSPKEDLWTNNNTESMNNRLKLNINWEPRKTDELVDKLHDVVKVQLVDMRRAMYSTGNFSLNPRFRSHHIPRTVWASRSADEQKKTFHKFLKSSLRKDSATVTSADGSYVVKKPPKLAKKPNQRTRCRPNRTRTY